MRGRAFSAGGQSHSWLTATRSSVRPREATISVAAGRSETMRICVDHAGPRGAGPPTSSRRARRPGVRSVRSPIMAGLRYALPPKLDDSEDNQKHNKKNKKKPKQQQSKRERRKRTQRAG